MDLLIAILLYLGVMNTSQSYTTADVNAIAYDNQQPVMMVSSDTTQMRIVSGTYFNMVQKVDLTDRTMGN